MDSPFLSICIPTFNRANFLRECLQSIVCQFSDSKVKSFVEIVISDNDSKDHTAQVVKEFQSQGYNIFYKKSSINFGVDRNILQVVEMAKGKYVWLLGDDDALFEDSLAYILDFLSKDQVDYVIANCWGYNKSLTEKALKYPNLHIDKNQQYATLSDYIKQADHNQGLVGLFCGLSVQIFLKKYWRDKSNKDMDIGTNAVHMYTLIVAMKNRRFCLLAKPCVKVRSDNIRWDVFEGLETLKKRSNLTKKALIKVLEEYHLPYSKFRLNLSFTRTLFLDTVRIFIRSHVLKSQKSRDLLKKFLGKL